MKNLICVSAPSGSGKTTLCKIVRKIRPEFIWSVSYTTRAPRKNEIDGEDYNFVNQQDFEILIDNGDLAEWENVHGNYYGTVKKELDNAILNKKIVLLELDVNGTSSIQKLYPDNSYSIFIVPPSIESLKKRLQMRGSETEATIKKRLERFKKEMEYKDRFDSLLINDNIEVAKDEFLIKLNQVIKGV
jgi:guanylate kinase